MKRSMRTLQRLKTLREQQAAAVLAGAELARRDAEADLAHRRAAHAALLAAQSTARDVDALIAARVTGLHSHDHVLAGVETVRGAETARDAAAEHALETRIARRSLDRLLERQQERADDEAARVEQAAADELAVLRWGSTPWS
jgi:hypothetical protein